jgi:hypothetical protein
MAKTSKSATMPAAVSVIEKPIIEPTHAGDRLSDVVDAFSWVPDEYRGDLHRYFNSSPGKYKLRRFLDALSEWWIKSELQVPVRLGDKHPWARSAGAFENDPTWDDMMKAIEEDRRALESDDFNRPVSSS